MPYHFFRIEIERLALSFSNYKKSVLDLQLFVRFFFIQDSISYNEEKIVKGNE